MALTHYPWVTPMSQRRREQLCRWLIDKTTGPRGKVPKMRALRWWLSQMEPHGIPKHWTYHQCMDYCRGVLRLRHPDLL